MLESLFGLRVQLGGGAETRNMKNIKLTDFELRTIKMTRMSPLNKINFQLRKWVTTISQYGL